MYFTIEYCKRSFHLFERSGSENQILLFSYPTHRFNYLMIIVSLHDEFIIPNESVDRYNFSVEFYGLQKFIDNVATELIIVVNPKVFDKLIPILKKIHRRKFSGVKVK